MRKLLPIGIVANMTLAWGLLIFCRIRNAPPRSGMLDYSFRNTGRRNRLRVKRFVRILEALF